MKTKYETPPLRDPESFKNVLPVGLLYVAGRASELGHIPILYSEIAKLPKIT